MNNSQYIYMLPTMLLMGLFLIANATGAPAWVKPQRKAHWVWARIHAIALIPAIAVAIALAHHPWYQDNIVARTGAAFLTYTFVWATQTDISYRKASEAHIMQGWVAYLLLAAITQDIMTVTLSISALVLGGLIRHWWASDATLTVVALSYIAPVAVSHPIVGLVNFAALALILIAYTVAKIYKKQHKQLKIPLAPVLLTPFTLVPLLPLLPVAMA